MFIEFLCLDCMDSHMKGNIFVDWPNSGQCTINKCHFETDLTHTYQGIIGKNISLFNKVKNAPDQC